MSAPQEPNNNVVSFSQHRDRRDFDARVARIQEVDHQLAALSEGDDPERMMLGAELLVANTLSRALHAIHDNSKAGKFTRPPAELVKVYGIVNDALRLFRAVVSDCTVNAEAWHQRAVEERRKKRNARRRELRAQRKTKGGGA